MVDVPGNFCHQSSAPEIPECWALEPPVMGNGSDKRGSWKSYWEGLGGTPQFFREQAKEYIRNLESAIAIDEQMRVLDFGCGFGFVAQILASQVGQVSLWDASPNMRCRAKLNVASHQNIRFLDLSDPQSLPADLRFDLILVNSVVQYMPVDEFSAWLVGWRRMLSQGGRIVVSDLIAPDYNSISDILDLLTFSVRHGVLGSALLRTSRNLRRYRRVRRAWPLGRIGLEELSHRGKAAGLAMTCLPANLTHFTKRFTVVLTEAECD